VCVLDHSGRVVDERTVPHEALALQALAEALRQRSQDQPATIAIGIERPHGALVELLVERVVPVYAINPKQLDRFRDRFTVAGAKDDRRDAHVLADSVRTDRPAFRRVHLDHPVVIQLREWSRVDEALQVDLTRLTNQLRDLVYRVTPALVTLCPGADEPWLWTLLALAPTPAAQQRLSQRRIEQVLRKHRIRRVTAAELRAVLHTPPMYTAPGVVEAVAAHCRLLLPRIELAATQRRACEHTMEQLLDQLDAQAPAPGDQREHSDVAILRSLPGVGIRVAARMLAEASQPLVERAYHTLRARMGVAPVTKQSGRRRTVSMRYACDPRLRQAAYHWARVSMQRDLRTQAYYRAVRARGHSHGRALRSAADRQLRILMALLKHRQLFDPAHSQPSAVGGPA
jgi:transposase